MSESVFGTVKTTPVTASDVFANGIGADGTSFMPSGNTASFQGGWQNKINNMKFNNQPSKGFNFGEMFSGKNLGGTLQAIGAIGGALASVYGVHEQKKFNKDMLGMEKNRVARETKRQDDKQAKYEAVWATG